MPVHIRPFYSRLHRGLLSFSHPPTQHIPPSYMSVQSALSVLLYLACLLVLASHGADDDSCVVPSSSPSLCHSKPSSAQGTTLASMENVAIVVRSQMTRPHKLRLQQMMEDWGFTENAHVVASEPEQASSSAPPRSLRFFPTHIFGGRAWAVAPVLQDIYHHLASTVQWILFIEDDTEVLVEQLADFLVDKNPSLPLFYGRPLYDHGLTIIHMFIDDQDFAYPDFSCGWIASRALLASVVAYLKNISSPEPAFTIDPQYEQARLIEKSTGITLQSSNVFCTRSKNRKSDTGDTKSSTISSRAESPCMTIAHGRPDVSVHRNVTMNDLSVAVKTAEKFHTSRLNFLRQSWGRAVKHIEYFSDKADPTIPTIGTGIPNTDSVGTKESRKMCICTRVRVKFHCIHTYLHTHTHSRILIYILRKRRDVERTDAQ